MGRRYSRVGPGLLGFFAFLSAVLCPVFSQETGYFPDPDYYQDYGLVPETAPPAESAGELEVLLETFPQIPEVHREWMIRILVNHPNPQDVSVIIPDLPSSLIPDRIRTAVRFIGRDGETNPGAEEKWTAVDFFFIPGRDGPVSLAPFEARASGRLGYSPPVSAVIRGDAGKTGLRAVWDPSPSSLRVGQSAEVRLRLITGEAEGRRAASISYGPEAPVNALIESLGIDEAENGEFILRFRIIPLAGSSVLIPSVPLQYGDASVTVPGHEFSVLPALPSASPVSAVLRSGPVQDGGTKAGDGAARTGGDPPPFPDVPGTVFPPFRGGYERALTEARLNWERGLYAEALAVLRLNERELAAGPALSLLRRSAETALGIGFTEDEKWRPRRIFLVLTAAASCILVFVLVSAKITGNRRKNFPVTSGFPRGYTFIVVFLCAMIGAGLCGFFGGPGRITRPGKSRTGILRETGAFKVPESGNVPAILFREGEPVRIRAVADPWAYVESFEGKTGWVPLDRIIPY
ncbi:MAG: hypothetical protein LBH57_01260 [Treponema sp.]|nr:hypothetical protein [Treponema sp.]